MNRSHPIKSDVTETATPVTIPPPEFAEALKSIAPAMHALTKEQLPPVNVDLAQAYTTVSGALPGLLALRPRLARLPEFDLTALDNLPVYTRALLFAHAVYSQEPAPMPSAQDKAQDCAKRLAVLMRATHSLMDVDLLPAETLDNYGKTAGYRPTAMETVALVATLRRAWPKLVGHTALTVEMLAAAEHSANELLEVLGEREHLEQAASDTMEQRLRAFALFARAYDEVRRGVLFLYWHEGDGEKVAPSFYRGRAGAHAKDPSAPADKPATPADAVEPNATIAALGGPALEPGFASAMPKSPLADS